MKVQCFFACMVVFFSITITGSQAQITIPQKVYVHFGNNENDVLLTERLVHSSWLKETLALNNTIGRDPDNPLTMDFFDTKSDFDFFDSILMKVDHCSTDEQAISTIVFIFKNKPLKELCIFITHLHNLRHNPLLYRAEKALVAIIKTKYLNRFASDQDFINMLRLPEEVVNTLSKMVLSSEEISDLQSQMYVDIDCPLSPSRIVLGKRGRFLLTCGEIQGRGFCRMWDTTTGSQRGLFKEFDQPLKNVAFCDGEIIIQSNDTIKAETESSEEIIFRCSDKMVQYQNQLPGSANLSLGTIWGSCLSIDNSLLAIGIGEQLFIHNIERNKSLPINFERGNASLSEGDSLFFTPDGSYLIETRQNGLIRIGSVANGFGTILQHIHKSRIIKHAITSNNVLYTLDDDGILCEWNISNTITGFAALLKEHKYRESNAHVFHGLAFNRASNRIAFSSPGIGIRILSLGREQDTFEKYVLQDEGAAFIQGCFHPEDKVFAAGNNKHEVIMWDTETGNTLYKLNFDGFAKDFFFSQDGNFLVGAFANGKLRLSHFTSSDLADTLKNLTLEQGLFLALKAQQNKHKASPLKSQPQLNENNNNNNNNEELAQNHLYLAGIAGGLPTALLRTYILRNIDFTQNKEEAQETLLNAIILNQERVISELIAKGFSPNELITVNGAEFATLAIAALAEKKSAFECLLANGAIIKEALNNTFIAGKNLLHMLAQSGKALGLSFVLGRDKSLINSVSKFNNWTPLHWAAFNGHTEAFNVLLDHGAASEAQDAYGYTPLHLAAGAGHHSIVARYKNVNMPTKRGVTPLHLAAATGRTELVSQLIAMKAELNTTCDDFIVIFHNKNEQINLGASAINISIGSVENNPSLTECALARFGFSSADLTEREKNELSEELLKAEALKTASHLAALGGHKNTLEVLINAGANQEVQTAMGFTVFDCAVLSGNIELVDWLLNSSTKPSSELVNAVTQEGISPLHLAASTGNQKMVAFLIDQGAKPQALTNRKNSLLYFATLSRNTQFVMWALEKYKDLCSIDGADCVDLARFREDTEILNLLLQPQNNIKIKEPQQEEQPARDTSKEKARAADIVEGFRKNQDTFEPKPATIECHYTYTHKGKNRQIQFWNFDTPRSGNDIWFTSFSAATTQTTEGFYLLHAAAQRNEVALIRGIFESPECKGNAQIKCNVKSKSGWTPLHIACAEGHVEAVKILLTKGADINEKTTPGLSTALTIATRYGHLPVVKILIEEIEKLPTPEECINDADSFGWTALHWAAFKNHKEVAVFLLKKGADKTIRTCGIQQQTAQKSTRLMKSQVSIRDGVLACDLASNEKMRSLLTPLTQAELDVLWDKFVSAVTSEQVDPIIDTIEAGAEINRAGFPNDINDIQEALGKEWTASHFAAAHGKLHLLELLLDKGAKINAKTSTGKTALDLAVEYKRSNVVDFLKSAAEDLIAASKVGDLNTISALLQKGIDINYKCNSNQRSALHWASRYGHLKCVQYLLQQGSNINSIDKDKKTVLATTRWALTQPCSADVRKEIEKVIKVLEQNGALDSK